MIDLDAIKAREQAATLGPWAWRGYVDRSIELRTVGQGGQRIVSTCRSEPCGAIDAAGDFIELEDACESCQKAWQHLAENGDVPEGLRCEKPENLDTVWVQGDGRIVPINRFAVREVPYRGDVASVSHPDAAFIAHARTDVPGLIRALEAIAHAAERFHEINYRYRNPFPIRGPRVTADVYDEASQELVNALRDAGFGQPPDLEGGDAQ